jgi:hypothetical protein
LGVAWVDGTAVAKVEIPEALAGRTVNFQAYEFKVAAGHTRQISGVLNATLGPAPLRIAGPTGNRNEGLAGPVSGELATAAVARWGLAGISPDELVRLQGVSIRSEDLPADVLAVTDGNRITLDTTAAGHGWFVDATPADDAEFRVAAGTSELVPPPGSPLSDQVDLLTVLLHELGHVLGRVDLASDSHSLMAGALSAGVRRLPDGVTPQSPQRQGAPPLWQNPLNRFDVNLDGAVTPLDALLVINELNLRGPHLLSEDANAVMSYAVDVTGDDFVSAMDVLGIINSLNAREAGRLLAEGEAPPNLPQPPTDQIPPLTTGLAASWLRPQDSIHSPSERMPAVRTPMLTGNAYGGSDDDGYFADEALERVSNWWSPSSSRRVANAIAANTEEFDHAFAEVLEDLAFAWHKQSEDPN